MMMQSTIAFLYAKPPSSLSMEERWVIMTECLWGYFWHNSLMARTTTTLNSSLISLMNEAICFINRSTLDSLPVLSKVVMASVAMLLFTSVIKFSRSKLQVVTADGCFMATLFKVLTPAYLNDGLGEDKKS